MTHRLAFVVGGAAVALASPALAVSPTGSVPRDRCAAAEARVVRDTGATVTGEDPNGLGVSFRHPDTPGLSLICEESLFGVSLSAGGQEPGQAWYAFVGRASGAALGVDPSTSAESARRCVSTAMKGRLGGSTYRLGRAVVICHAGDGAPVSVTVTSTARGQRVP